VTSWTKTRIFPPNNDKNFIGVTQALDSATA
jgi:hypothetical protein